jgi:hypothetical protein
VLDDEEAVERLESDRRHGEEVEGNNHLAMIVQEGQPFLARISATTDSTQVPRDGSLRDVETKL